MAAKKAFFIVLDLLLTAISLILIARKLPSYRNYILHFYLVTICHVVIIYHYVTSKSYYDYLGNAGLIGFIVLIVIVGIFLLISLIGLVGKPIVININLQPDALCIRHCSGICVESKVCLVVFSFLLGLWMLVFLAIGIVFVVLPARVIGSGCTDNQDFRRLQAQIENSQNVLCDSCRCYFPKRLDPNVYPLNDSALQIELNRLAPNYSATNSSVPVNVQSCAAWSGSNPDDTNFIVLLETNFRCTGWCSNTSSPFYRFTNVNNGIPQDTCYSALKHFVERYDRVIFIVAFVIAGLMLLTLIMTCLVIRQIDYYKYEHNAVRGVDTQIFNNTVPNQNPVGGF